MKRDGKALQDLTEFVETTLHPLGFEVVTNQVKYDEDGHALAEFDIQFIGTHENSGYKWLIECRDRPSDGRAPGSWIEQLVGRRSRFGFNKVTAVSSTGFAPGALDYATAESIELKEVASMRPEHFSKWLAIDSVEVIDRTYQVNDVHFVIPPGLDQARVAALDEVIRANSIGGKREPLFRGLLSGERRSLDDIFFEATTRLGDWEDLVINGSKKTVVVHLQLDNPQGAFCIDTALAAEPVSKVSMRGDLWLTSKSVPFERYSQYQKTGDEGGFIAQSVKVVMMDDGKTKAILEIHHIPESGYSHVVLRAEASKADDKKT